ncbi:MAG TPA: flagellar motor switch protein FliG, partial [Beijerinckiaceae bacterium]
MTGSPSERHLTGAEKVAALLLAMDRGVAGAILKRFETQEIREITMAATGLGRISSPEFDELVEEFAGHFSVGADLLGSRSDAEKLLESALPPEAVTSILSDLSGDPSRNVWQQIAALPDALVATHLEKEHPQVVAFVLSKTPTSFAAAVLAALPTALRNEATRRLVALRPPVESVLRMLEKSLHETLVATAN